MPINTKYIVQNPFAKDSPKYPFISPIKAIKQKTAINVFTLLTIIDNLKN